MSKVKGLSAERIARRFLEGKGFNIISTNYEIKDGDEKVAEVDIIAEDSKGKRYAVEVKSGNGDVNAIRQTYGNANLCGYQPLLVCKGYANEGAEKAAERLNVRVLELSEYYLILEPEELEDIVKKCVEEVFETHGFLPFTSKVEKDDEKKLEIISTSENFDEAAERMSLNRKELGKEIQKLTEKGILPKRSLSFQDLKRCCGSILSRIKILEKLDRIEKLLK